jgi:tRNA A58 N-methylase Trm61
MASSLFKVTWSYLQLKSLHTTTDNFLLCFPENDVVLLVKKGDNSTNPMMTKPLRHSRKMQTHVGQINHSDIIGKSIRDILPTKKGDWRIQRPSLADYIINTPRIVTPASIPSSQQILCANFNPLRYIHEMRT